ncbi:hypothetical protein cyc_08208 [Cyclospora cayetanensis]|uniref:Uncharacterized protein n=1 Tax=Cyclospora cayetanensis TaxID=88456 RepID=A0A1D3D600_9EIME|nr:hypothetical protein cyc_08208 [Cyclospora cayetanensis]
MALLISFIAVRGVVTVTAALPWAPRLPAVRGRAGETLRLRMQQRQEVLRRVFHAVLLMVAMRAKLPGRAPKPR